MDNKVILYKKIKKFVQYIKPQLKTLDDEDVVHEVFLSSLHLADRVNEDNLIFVHVVRRVINLRRNEYRRTLPREDACLEEIVDEHAKDPASLVENDEVLKIINDVVPPNMRENLLRWMHGVPLPRGKKQEIEDFLDGLQIG